MIFLISFTLVFFSVGLGISGQTGKTYPEIIFKVGARGTLPCPIQRRSNEVQWKRRRTSETEHLVSLYPYSGARDGPGYKAGLFNITEDYSLVIKDVKVVDEGLYLCMVSDYETEEFIQKWTRVFVQALDQCTNEVHDCSPHAICIDLSEHGYTCQCNAGFKDSHPTLPGRNCTKKSLNECTSDLHDCSPDAFCIDLSEHGYTCHCNAGFNDSDPTLPGRNCTTLTEVEFNQGNWKMVIGVTVSISGVLLLSTCLIFRQYRQRRWRRWIDNKTTIYRQKFEV